MSGDDDAEGRPPLDDLTEAVRERRTGAPDGDLWNQFEPPDDADRAWEHLGRIRTAGSEPTADDRRAGGYRFAPAYASDEVLAVHGVVTAGVLGLALLVYLLALLGLIPAEFWLFGLPLLAVGLVGLVPVLAWLLGIWNPRELS